MCYDCSVYFYKLLILPNNPVIQVLHALFVDEKIRHRLSNFPKVTAGKQEGQESTQAA